MNEKQTLEVIGIGRLVAILRGDFKGREEEIVSVMIETGVTAVEVTLNSPNALEAIGRLARRFGNRTAIGAGTVLGPDEVERVAEVGGSFIVSPNRNIGVIETTKRLGLVSLPGCFTPSEIIEAFEAGADAAKIFPATTLGPAYIKAVRAPLGNVRLVPTGGVTPENASEYLAAGAWALGVGSELVGKDVLKEGGLEALRQRAMAFVEAAKGSVTV